MFHLQSLELLQWDYCQRLTLPLDGSIITIAGPNGSGKTTLLDAMRTLLGLDCSGGRSYKTYARHANADTTWLRATVDNRPHGRQTSTRPFARNLLYADQVTLACRIERNGGDWQRRYCMSDGDVAIETLAQLPEKDWLGLDHWRKRLEGAGLSRAIARVLALEQGQTDRLCEFSPKELLRLVFEVFGDQEVLDRYEEARRHQRDLAAEVTLAEQELAYSEAQLAQLDSRVTLYRTYQGKLRERETLATEVIPVLRWHEERQGTATRLRELHRQRLHHHHLRRQRSSDTLQLSSLLTQQQAAREKVTALERDKAEAQQAQQKARDAEKPVEELVKQADELLALSAVEGDATQLLARVEELEQQKSTLHDRWRDLEQQRKDASGALDRLTGQRQAPRPNDVQQFTRALRQAGIAHHLLADVIEIADDQWRAAAEGVLRASCWVVVLDDPKDEAAAMALAERERYRHYVVSDAAMATSQPPAESLLAVLRFSAKAPSWLLRQLAQIRRVADTVEGASSGGEWITPQAYWRDGRGGRSVWRDPGDYQFGAAAMAARQASIQKRLASLDADLTDIVLKQSEVKRQLDAAKKATEGHLAAEALAKRSEEFEQARRQLPALKAARVAASERWSQFDVQYADAIEQRTILDGKLDALQRRLRDSEGDLAGQERDWRVRHDEQRARALASRAQKGRFPAHWIATATVQALYEKYSNAKQAELRMASVDNELETGHWEKDGTVEDKHLIMQGTVGNQRNELDSRKISNHQAEEAVGNARERYIDVLKATVRRYRRNIVDLGALAGVVVSADLPHLDNDDTILRQAELKVSFNFDGKGEIGLNDGEASGGQQVIKSLILLVGLLKDDDMPGGFVFIDEPFAHLDVRNIQLVGNFLKSTRAQYVLTTPITHNVEVFEPADITLVTSKKPREARWAPPIGVLQRRLRLDA